MLKNKAKLKAIRWCCKWLRKQAKELDIVANRTTWDSTGIVGPKECRDRAYMLRGLAKELLRDAKQKWS